MCMCSWECVFIVNVLVCVREWESVCTCVEMCISVYESGGMCASVNVCELHVRVHGAGEGVSVSRNVTPLV